MLNESQAWLILIDCSRVLAGSRPRHWPDCLADNAAVGGGCLLRKTAVLQSAAVWTNTYLGSSRAYLPTLSTQHKEEI